MKVLGISGSPREGSTTDQLVQQVLDGVECETQFISLAGKSGTSSAIASATPSRASWAWPP